MTKAASDFKSLNYTYPWEKWANGKTHDVQQGRHFMVSPASFRATLYTRARRIGKRVQVSIKGKLVRFQFAAKKRVVKRRQRSS